MEPAALENLIAIFLAARDQLLNTIINYQGVGTKVYANTILKQLEKQLKLLEKQSSVFASTAIPKEYQKALDDVYAYFQKNNLQMVSPAAFAQIHNDAIYAVAREMQYQIGQGLEQAGRQVLRYVNAAQDNALRTAGLEATGEKLASGGTIQTMKQNLIGMLQDQGFMSVQYGSGKNAYQVSLDSYAAMVSRSTTREAGNLARLNQLTANGYDLVKISEHYPTCKLCSQFQGRVYSISGKDKRFPPLETAFRYGYKNIHPNCRHVAVPWVEALKSAEEKQAAMDRSNAPFEDNRPETEKALYNKQQGDIRQTRQDLYQYERMKARLGSDATGSFHTFRQAKNAGGESWDLLQRKYGLYVSADKLGTLPNAHVASTSESKLKGYLLNKDHPVGKDKAFVINSVLGYNDRNWTEFADKIYVEVQKSPVIKSVPGINNSVKFEVPMVISGKKDRSLEITTVWQIDKDSSIPRFITAVFPNKKGGA